MYGNDPLKMESITPDSRDSHGNIVKKVKFFPSPDFANDTALKHKNRIDVNHASESFGINQTERARNEYNEMKNNYLKNRQFGANRQMNSFF